MITVTKKAIEAFYAGKRLAIVGVSRSKHDYSRRLFAEFRKRGYDVVPVNPNAPDIDGIPCAATLKAVTPVVDRAIVLLPGDKADAAVSEGLDAGVKMLWVHNMNRNELAALKAPELCAKRGSTYISGYCPFMLMHHPGFPHGMHAGVAKLIGHMPK